MRRYAPVVLACVVVLASCTSEAPTEAVPSPSASPVPTVEPTPTPEPITDPFVAAAAVASTGSADEVAVALRRLEEAIRSGEVEPARAAFEQQAIYRRLVDDEALRSDVLARFGGEDDVAHAVRANVEAGAELRRLTSPREELPDEWRIVSPPSAADLRSHHEAAAREFGIDWTYLAAIHLVETRMGRIRGTSIAGAKGPMQFLPSTWEAYGEGDIEDFRDAIRAAGRYLAAHGAPGDMDRALYAYNHSDRYVRAVSLHAEVMRRHPAAFDAYHGWQVYYRTTRGDALLWEGWPQEPFRAP